METIVTKKEDDKLRIFEIKTQIDRITQTVMDISPEKGFLHISISTKDKKRFCFWVRDIHFCSNVDLLREGDEVIFFLSKNKDEKYKFLRLLEFKNISYPTEFLKELL